MVQTEFGENIGFSMRTFRFIVAGTQTEAQQQTISCHLYLEPATDVTPIDQPADCSCYSEAQCSLPGRGLRRNLS